MRTISRLIITPMPNFISEDQIEQVLLQRLQHLCGFDVLGCDTADPADLLDHAAQGRKWAT